MLDDDPLTRYRAAVNTYHHTLGLLISMLQDAERRLHEQLVKMVEEEAALREAIAKVREAR